MRLVALLLLVARLLMLLRESKAKGAMNSTMVRHVAAELTAGVGRIILAGGLVARRQSKGSVRATLDLVKEKEKGPVKRNREYIAQGKSRAQGESRVTESSVG